MTAEASATKPTRTQAWLQEIYARPAEFLGLTVAILNDEEILLTAPTFRAAREGVAKLDLPAERPDITYFHVRVLCRRFVFSRFGCAVAWCQDAAVDEMILGRKDVFDAFFVEFRQSDKRVIFTPAPSGLTSAVAMS